jgi:hypothetical protein
MKIAYALSAFLIALGCGFVVEDATRSDRLRGSVLFFGGMLCGALLTWTRY